MDDKTPAKPHKNPKKPSPQTPIVEEPIAASKAGDDAAKNAPLAPDAAAPFQDEVPPAPAAQDAPPPEPAAETATEEFPSLREAVVRVLKTVYDPEIPVNIYELGLIYSIEIKEESFVHIRMTLTAPGCPVADILPAEVEAKVRAVPGVRDVELELVWEPAWNMTMMSEAARLTIGMF